MGTGRVGDSGRDGRRCTRWQSGGNREFGLEKSNLRLSYFLINYVYILNEIKGTKPKITSGTKIYMIELGFNCSWAKNQFHSQCSA